MEPPQSWQLLTASLAVCNLQRPFSVWAFLVLQGFVRDEPFPMGAIVRHEKYGLGEVVELTGFGQTRTVKVRFQTAGVKPFRVSHVKLEVIKRA